MPLSMYQLTVPVYVRSLSALSTLLDKAAAHAAGKKFDPAVLVGARLAPDMFSLAEQVRATCNYPIRSCARLAGLPIPTFDGKDATIADLKARIAWTIDFVKSVDQAKIEGTDEKEIVFPSGDKERRMLGKDYILAFAYPHFYFHLTAAYAILRHNGVPLVKDDYMG